MEFREFRKEDTPALEAIIRQTWNYDKFVSPKTAQKLARVFLSSCLTNQTFSQVALENGKPVGIILGKNISAHKCPFSYRWKQICSLISLYLTQEGRNASKIFGSVNGIDEYSCAATPQIRQTGNRLSGLAETAYASLLAQCFV